MSRVILLDSGPLGLLTAPPGMSGPTTDCTRWLAGRLAAGDRVLVPEITDYETRREQVRAKKAKRVGRLNALAATVCYLPLTTAVIRHAADLWATARQTGQPTAADDTIDADMILCVQAVAAGPGAVIATTNAGRLRPFSPGIRLIKGRLTPPTR